MLHNISKARMILILSSIKAVQLESEFLLLLGIARLILKKIEDAN